MSTNNYLGSVLFGCLFFVSFSGQYQYALAHPFHTTTAEMEYNATTKRFEVSLKIAASDFEQMVQDGADAWVDSSGASEGIVATKAASKELVKLKRAAQYLEKCFCINLVGSEGKACRFEWVGIEDDAANKWVYFELVLPTEQFDSGELTLTNKVLCDRNIDQINTVVFISRAKRVSLKTHERQNSVALPQFQ